MKGMFENKAKLTKGSLSFSRQHTFKPQVVNAIFRDITGLIRIQLEHNVNAKLKSHTNLCKILYATKQCAAVK